MTSDMPDIENMDKLAEWFDKETLDLIGHILNKHTKACLSQMKELVIERKELKRRLSEARSIYIDLTNSEYVGNKEAISGYCATHDLMDRFAELFEEIKGGE